MRYWVLVGLFLWAGQVLAQVPLVAEARYNAPYRALAQAYAALDSSAIVAAYTTAAVYLTPTGPKTGKAAIGAYLGGFLAAVRGKGAVLTLSFALVHRSVTAEVVTDVGYYRLQTTLPDGSTTVGYGKFVTQSLEELGAFRFAFDTDRGGVTEADFNAATPLPLH